MLTAEERIRRNRVRANKWYHANKSRALEASARYRDKMRAQDPVGWKAKNTNRSREWRNNNLERHRLTQKNIYKKNRIRHYVSVCIKRALERSTARGIKFSISSDFALALMEEQKNTCALSGLPFLDPIMPGRPWPYSPSLDRINPLLGYVETNVRFVLHGVNSLKGNGTDEDVLIICKALLDRQNAQ